MIPSPPAWRRLWWLWRPSVMQQWPVSPAAAGMPAPWQGGQQMISPCRHSGPSGHYLALALIAAEWFVLSVRGIWPGPGLKCARCYFFVF